MAQLDSKKLEKLLSSATSERQRKMYQSLLQKARIQEQASKKSPSVTQTKVKSQAILGKVEKQEKTQAKSSGVTETKVKSQAILGKVEQQEKAAVTSSGATQTKNQENPPKVELASPTVLEKPPVREPEPANLSSLPEEKTTTQTTHNLATETNKDKESNQAELDKNQAVSKEEKSQDKTTKTAKAKGTKKKAQRTQGSEEIPIFQALGKMILSPYLKENNLKVEINGQEYALLYGDDFTFVAHKNLRRQLVKSGSRKMLLKLYPNVQFSNKSEKPKLSFILGGFENKYYTNRQYPEKFKLRGIWQYVPFCQTPVISIYRNLEQLWQFQKLNEKEQLKLAKPHHIPVVWDDAPVEPFKYVAEVPKEEQMPRYFVEVRAIIKDGVYVVQEMLKEPTLNIPPYIKGEKLKDYDFKNLEAYFKKLNNSKTSKAKDSSLSNPGKFQFVLRGQVLTENESEVFQLENGTSFTVKEILPGSYSQEITEWQVVPVINNEAQIVSLILEKPLSSTELITTPSNLIIEAGRIIEVGKIDDRFKIRVHRHKGKNLKITAYAGEVKMKVGQLWSMKLSLKEGSLYVQEAQYLKD